MDESTQHGSKVTLDALHTPRSMQLPILDAGMTFDSDPWQVCMHGLPCGGMKCDIIV